MRKTFFAILFATASVFLAQAQVEQTHVIANDTTLLNPKDKTSIQDFNNLSATYLSWFNLFPDGYYGLRYETFATAKGFMVTVAIKGSWGTLKPGFFEFRWGFGKGWAINENIALVIPGSILIGDYTSLIQVDNNLNVRHEKSLGYGLLASPGIRFKFGRAIFGITFDLGIQHTGGTSIQVFDGTETISAEINGKVDFYKSFELSAGFTF